MKSSKIAIACIFCLYALLLFSCKTTDEAAKQKEQPLPAAEKSGDSKAAMYHALMTTPFLPKFRIKKNKRFLSIPIS